MLHLRLQHNFFFAKLELRTHLYFNTLRNTLITNIIHEQLVWKEHNTGKAVVLFQGWNLLVRLFIRSNISLRYIRERLIGRQSVSQLHRQSNKQTDRQSITQTVRQTGSQLDRQSDRQAGSQIDRQSNRKIIRQRGSQSDRQPISQTDTTLLTPREIKAKLLKLKIKTTFLCLWVIWINHWEYSGDIYHSWSSGDGISPAKSAVPLSTLPCHQFGSCLLMIWMMSPVWNFRPASLHGMRSSFMGS